MGGYHELSHEAPLARNADQVRRTQRRDGFETRPRVRYGRNSVRTNLINIARQDTDVV